jgi:hypothetical protein
MKRVVVLYLVRIRFVRSWWPLAFGAEGRKEVDASGRCALTRGGFAVVLCESFVSCE